MYFFALVQPTVVSTQDAVKDASFSTMMPPTTTLPGTFMPSAIPGAGVFNPVGVQSQQAAVEKAAPPSEGMDSAAELTLQGKSQNLACSQMRCLSLFLKEKGDYMLCEML